MFLFTKHPIFFYYSIAKYAEREKHNRQAVEEYQQISRLLEDRNRQASKLKKKSDISEIEESLHTYLKMIEEFPDEKEEEEIPALPELTADMEVGFSLTGNVLICSYSKPFSHVQ